MVTKKELRDYVIKNKVCKRKSVAQHFNTYPNQVSRLLEDEELFFDLNDKKNKHFTILSVVQNKFDVNGLCTIKGRVFSKMKYVKPSIIKLVDSSSCGLKRQELDSILKTDTRIYLRELTKNGQVFRARIKKADIYFSTDGNKRMKQIENNKEDVIMDVSQKQKSVVTEGINSLDKSDPVLRDLEIVRQIKSGKKIVSIAKEFDINRDTVNNICKRFEKNKTKGLIHERKCKPYKISSSTEAAIISEAIKHHGKSPKEIAEILRNNLNLSVKTIKNVISKFKSAIEAKNKTFFFNP